MTVKVGIALSQGSTRLYGQYSNGDIPIEVDYNRQALGKLTGLFLASRLLLWLA